MSMPRPFSTVEWSRSRIVPRGLLFPAGIKRVLHAFLQALSLGQFFPAFQRVCVLYPLEIFFPRLRNDARGKRRQGGETSAT